MSANVEQIIAVKIKAIVTGLSEVQALSLSVRGLNKSGGNGLRGVTGDVKGLSGAARLATPELGGLALAFGRLTEKAQKNGLGVFVKDLGAAARQLKAYQDLERKDPFQSAKNLSLKQAGKELATRPSIGQSSAINNPSSALASGLARHDPFQTANNRSFAQAAADLKLFEQNAKGAEKGLFGVTAQAATVNRTFAGMKLTATGASGALLSIVSAGTLLVAIMAAIGVGAAALGFSAFVSEGIRFNAVIESARIGIASLVANTYDIKDASGNLASPIDSFNASLNEANSIERRLQKSAIETKYEFEDILQFFNSTLVAGAGLNMSLDQAVALTNDLSLAAGAINLPVEKVNTGIKQILTGYTTVRNDLAKAIFPGESTRQINGHLKQWKQAGTLIDEVDKRLAVFRLSADQVSQSFEAVASNISDAFKVFAADATVSLFNKIKAILGFIILQIVDLSGETVKLTPAFQIIADVLDNILSLVGDTLLGYVQDIFAWIRGGAEYLKDNESAIYDIVKALIAVAEQVGGILVDLGSVVGETANAGASAHDWAVQLQGVALFVGFIRDIINVIVGAVQTVIGLIAFGWAKGFEYVNYLAESIAQWILKAVGLFDEAAAKAQSLQGFFAEGSNRTFNFLMDGVNRTQSGLNAEGTFGAQDRLNQQLSLPKIPPAAKKFSFNPRKSEADNDANKQKREREKQLSALRSFLDALADAQLAAARKQLDLETDTNALVTKALDRRYENNLISAADYFSEVETLREKDLNAEEKYLKRQLEIEKQKARREIASFLDQADISDEEFDAYGAQLQSAKLPQDDPNFKAIDSTDIKNTKALTAYTKYAEKGLQIETQLGQLDNKRTQSKRDQTAEIQKANRAMTQQISDLNGELLSAFDQGDSASILDLQKRISDELPKILTETNPVSEGLKKVAEDIHAIGVVDLSDLPKIFADAGVEVSSLSQETQDFLKLFNRLTFLAATKQINFNVGQVESRFTEDTSITDDKVDRGEITRSAGRDEAIARQKVAVAELQAQLVALDELIKKLESTGVVTDTEKRLADGIRRRITAIPNSGIFDSLSAEADSVTTAMDERKAEAQRKFRDDKLSENELRDQTLQIERDEAAALQNLIAQMEKLPNLTLEQKQALAELKGQVADLGVATDSFAVAINEQIAGGLSTFFDDLVDKPGEILASFGKMVSGMLLGFAKVILQAIILKAILSALGIGAGSGGGGFGGILSGILGQSPVKKAEGGIISGPGTSISDSVPALLSHGEGVIPTARVQQYGRGMIQSIIDGRFLPSMRLARGGFADSIGAGTASNQMINKTRILNILDPSLVKDYLASADGENIILNVIAKHGKSVNQMLVG